MSPPAGVVDGLLADRYRLVSRLGSGGNGEVWRARDERLARDVAVKVLRPELADDEDVRARFRAEARAAGGLRHPGIAAVFDFAEDAGGAWLVMELVHGVPLSQVLRAAGRLPVDQTLDVVEQVAAALQVAHDGGVVHRDVKPGNLLLRNDGRVSVTDFGIASAAGAAPLTRTGQVVGTAAYLSPEQASGKPVSGASDVYALGVVAYECLAGARPFARDEPVAVLLAHLQEAPPPLPPDVPRPVAELVHRMLAKDPADRPTPARQVQREAAALRHPSVTSPALPAATAVLPAPAAADGPADRSPRPAVLGLAGRPGQRRAVRATAVALGLLALALGVRDALTDDPAAPSDPRRPRPVSSVHASTAPVTPTGQAPTQQAPTQQAPTEQAPAVQPQPVEQPVEQPQGGAQQPGSGEQQRKQVDKDLRKAEKEQDEPGKGQGQDQGGDG